MFRKLEPVRRRKAQLGEQETEGNVFNERSEGSQEPPAELRSGLRTCTGWKEQPHPRSFKEGLRGGKRDLQIAFLGALPAPWEENSVGGHVFESISQQPLLSAFWGLRSSGEERSQASWPRGAPPAGALSLPAASPICSATGDWPPSSATWPAASVSSRRLPGRVFPDPA